MIKEKEKEWKIGIAWGVISDSISVQLDRMHVVLPNSRTYDKVKDALNKLALSGLFTDSQISGLYKRAHDKLMKDLKASIMKMDDDQYLRFARAMDMIQEESDKLEKVVDKLREEEDGRR